MVCSIQGAPFESIQRLETGIMVERAESAVCQHLKKAPRVSELVGPFTVEDAKAQGGKKTCPLVMAANTVCTLSQGPGAPSGAGNHSNFRHCVLPPTTRLSTAE